MVNAIKKEIDLRKNELQNKNLQSLYFGGGTPSLLSSDELKSIFDEVLKYFTFAADIEITLEANPDDLDANNLKGIVESGVNRLSIGTQSFHDADLQMMNRTHNAQEAESSIKRSQDFGLENISIDLIYGAPTSDFEIWKENLQKTVALQVPHVSSYALTIEPKTALSQWIKQSRISAPKESEQNREFYYMSEFLKDHGFDHYEISNFGKPGFYSRHNSAYWKYQEYLGIGPSAHSYKGNEIRSWNVANNQHYLKALAENRLPNETEILSEKDQFNEMIMIGLRTVWGVDLEKIQEKFSEEIQMHLQNEIQHKIDDGTLVVDNGFLKIPEKHWFLADGIASDLFLIN